jgi:hypothetical protein
MIALNRRTKIFVCKEATDMRASYDSLFTRARDVLRQDPRRFSRINPLFVGEAVLTEAEFGLFFEGANLEKRFIDSPSEIRLDRELHKRSRTTENTLKTAAI